MRVTSNLIYSQSAYSMSKANERFLKINEKVSEQSNIVRPSDDPNGAGQVLRYQSSSQLLDQYGKNMTLAKNSLQYEHTAMDSLEIVFNQMRTLLTQSVNGANAQVDLDSIASELSQLVDSAADLMNSKDSSGKYIFSGTNASDPAFVKDASGKYVYAGNQAQQHAQIAETVSIAVSDSGKDVFQDVWTRNTFSASVTAGAETLTSDVSDQDAFNRFVRLRYDGVTPANNDYTLTTTAGSPNQFTFTDSAANVVASGNYVSGEPISFNGMSFTLSGTPGSSINVSLDPPTRDNVLNQVMSAIDALRDPNATDHQRELATRDASVSIRNTQSQNMSTAWSEVGARLAIIEAQTNFSAAKSVFNAEAQENIAGLDVYKASTELKLSETAVSASQALFTRLSNLSLFNYL